VEEADEGAVKALGFASASLRALAGDCDAASTNCAWARVGGGAEKRGRQKLKPETPAAIGEAPAATVIPTDLSVDGTAKFAGRSAGAACREADDEAAASGWGSSHNT
jgi:hypothetical protein